MRDSRLIEDLRLLSAPDHGWLLWVLGAVLLAAVVWRWRRRVTSGTGRAAAADPRWQAWEEAMRALERLGVRLEPECSRAYGIEVTDILRRYVEGRYGLSAPRLTTLEFLEGVRRGGTLAGAEGEQLGRFLGACDWMKFGRALAEGGELREMHGQAVAFVLGSRPLRPEVDGPAGCGAESGTLNGGGAGC